MVASTACMKAGTSNCPPVVTNFIRFSDARLHAVSSRNMYSEQGLLALMRAVDFEVCQRLTVGRGLPPRLMTPAKASKPFMKLTGPEAMPPPESASLLPRRVEKFVPVPEPHLNNMPSVLAKSMMEPMSSLTELIKQAEHCGLAWTPTLNQPGS